MRIHLIVLSFMLLVSPLFSWERTYGMESYDLSIRDIEYAYDNGYMILGSRFDPLAPSGTGRSLVVIKINEDGDALWTRTYGDSAFDYSGFNLVQTADSCYVIGSRITRGLAEGSFFILKIDANGDSITSFEYDIGGRANGRCLNRTQDGGFVMGGSWTPLPGTVPSHAVIIRVDADFETLWVRDYGGDVQTILNSIEQTEEGDFFACGEVSRGGGNYDILVMRTNSSGDSIWARTFASDSIASAISMVTIPGKIITAGYLAPVSVLDDNDASLHCFDHSGALLWHNEIGGRNLESANDIIYTSSGDLVTIGSISYPPSMTQDIYSIKCSIDGDSIWAKTYDSGVTESGKTLLETPDGGFILGASRGGVGMDGEIYILKTDSLGELTAISEIDIKPEILFVSVSPNPFNSAISITAPADAKVKIFDVNGRMVDELGSPVPTAPGQGNLASTTVVWTPDASRGSGVYLVRATVGEQSRTKRVVYLK